MNRNLLLIATLALAPLVGSAASVTYNPGDLLVGFRVLSGQGAGQDYLVNVASASALRDHTKTGVLTNVGADLTATFGAGWFDRTDIQWGAAASASLTQTVNGDEALTSYISYPQDTAGVNGAAPVITNSTSFRQVSTYIVTGLSVEFKNNGVATANNPAATFQNDSNQVSWRAYMDGGGTKGAFGDFNNFDEIEAIPAKTLAVYRFPTVNGKATLEGVYIGYLSLTSAGAISFTPGQDTGPDNSYATWAQTNAGGQTAAQDFDGDGISNGIEYFMGTAANAATPPIVPAGGSIVWQRSATAVVTAFRVETSTDLVNWTDATSSAAVTASNITYTLPTGSAKTFVRLAVDLP